MLCRGITNIIYKLQKILLNALQTIENDGSVFFLFLLHFIQVRKSYIIRYIIHWSNLKYDFFKYQKRLE
jgi:hypothetical protein